MFSTKKDDVKIGGKFFPIAADNKDVRLMKVTWEKIKENHGMVFYWKMGTLELKDIIFDKKLNSEYLYPKVGETKKDALKRFHKDVGSKVRHIMSMFVSDEVIENMPPAESLEDFTTNVRAILKPKGISDYPLYLKTIANKSGFATIPQNAIEPFVQLMNTGPCTLAYNDYERDLNEKYKYKPGVKESTTTDQQNEPNHQPEPQQEEQIPIGNTKFPPDDVLTTNPPVESTDDKDAW